MEKMRLNSLQKWGTKPNRKPLILRGARQVGKTFYGHPFFEYFNFVFQ